MRYSKVLLAPRGYWTVPQAAQYLDVSEAWIYQAIKAGKLKPAGSTTRIGASGRLVHYVLISQKAARKWKKNAEPGRPLGAKDKRPRKSSGHGRPKGAKNKVKV